MIKKLALINLCLILKNGGKMVPKQYRIEKNGYLIIVKFYRYAGKNKDVFNRIKDARDGWCPGEALGRVIFELTAANGKKVKYKIGNVFKPVSLSNVSSLFYRCYKILREKLQRECEQEVKKFLLATLIREAFKPYKG